MQNQNQTPLQKKLHLFLKQAQVSESQNDHVVAYYCQLFAHRMGIVLVERSEFDSLDARDFLTDLENKMFESREKIPQDTDVIKHVSDAALKIFNQAEDEDSSDNITQSTAIRYVSSSVIFDVLTLLYGSEDKVPQEYVDKKKYAKAKSHNILTCLRNGTQPQVILIFMKVTHQTSLSQSFDPSQAQNRNEQIQI
eukprot:TRINITY_DN5465_c0_g1_i1.p1 TRINITY_DN5465_c0_g1~~TRINITY_DN5465_c0_g1_i1.p1  ORF type:complete len:195 (+),score=32.33 TRINITY_DN5465_c0_g1_i1:53-637(+)